VSAWIPDVLPASALTLPNAITISGQASMLAWLAGASPWFLAWGLAADELDGKVARATGQTSEAGSALDWGVSVSLSSLMLWQLGAPWAIPVVLFSQAILRGQDWGPPVGSWAAVIALYGFFTGRLPARRFL
jgi:phosphatidylglycerophosphate synthase